jgi:serine/threonine protein kinase
MLEETPDRLDEAAALRARIAADAAAGRTVVLSAAEMASPQVREALPELLDELADRGATTAAIRVPGYDVLGEIGRGGMSAVHLARQSKLGRKVALKVAPKWLGSDERAQRRLGDEARAMARVQHPNVVAIHDVVDLGDAIAIAMDWIDGLSLAALLRALPGEARDDEVGALRAALGGGAAAFAGERDVRRCFARMVRDVARAVQCVHDAGLLHLDVKPSNVLVRRDGTPLLADFGVVRELAGDAGATRSFAGTPAYAAPEQIRRDDRAIGPRTDVYALGLTLYEAVARRQPLRDLDLATILETVERGRMPPLRELAAAPRELADIVHKAIAPEPALRYASAGALADDLDAWLAGRPVTARPLSTWGRTRRWVRHEPWKAALAGSLALLVPTLLVVGGYLLRELPNIEQQRRARLRAEADDLKQRAFQDFFANNATNEDVVARLRAALALDPTPASLVCLLAMQHEEQDEGLAATLAAHAATVAAHPGLQRFAAKVAAGRSFFDAAELTAFDVGGSPIDAYVVALDRLFFADDRHTEDAQREALDRIVVASTAVGDDPLLEGLQGWAMREIGTAAQRAGYAQAMRARRPGDRSALVWASLALENRDPAAAMVDARAATQQTPSDPWGWELLVGISRRNEAADLPKPTELLAQAKAAGADSPRLRAYALLEAAFAGDVAAAAEALREPEPGQRVTRRRLRLLQMVDPAAARAECERAVAAERPSWPAISAVHMHAAATRDAGLGRRAFAQASARFPDRRGLHLAHVALLYSVRELDGANDTLREAPFTDRELLGNGPLIASLLVDGHAWQTLRPLAERWLRLANPAMAPQAATYAGMAASRLGDHAAAAAHFAFACAVEPASGKWYAHALEEDAWVRVAPDAPDAVRDPALAAARLRRLDAYAPKLKQRLHGRWTSLVRAEVALANGDLAAARAAAEAARSLLTVERWAPDELDAWTERALARTAPK